MNKRKKIFTVFLAVCFSIFFCSCGREKERPVNEYLTCALITAFDDDSMTLDICEWITNKDVYKIRDLMYQGIITKNGYTDNHLDNGYFVYNPEDITVTFKLDEKAIYSFFDWHHQFEPQGPNENYVTTDYSEFKSYLYMNYRDGIPGMPLFFDIQDGVITKIVEIPVP